VSVTALSGETLAARGATNVLSLSNLAPGLRVNAADTSASPKLYIRGVGLSDFNPNASSSVGVYVDGVYVGSPLAQMAGFFDLAQVEVLRGPQGTLYGRNTNGGAINITTKRPTQSYSAEAALEYATYNAVNAQLGVGGPIVADKLAFRAAGQFVKDDGYVYNRATGDDLNATRYGAARLSLLFTPTSDLEVLAQVNRSINRSDAIALGHRALFPTDAAAGGPDGLCAPSLYASGRCVDLLGYADTDRNKDAVDSNLQGKDKVDLFGSSAQVTWKLGAVSLVSVTAWQWAHRNDPENTDASPLRMLEIDYLSRQRQFTQELRLQSNASDARFNWVLGAYYLDETVKDAASQDTLRDLRPLFATPDNPTGLSLENSVADFSHPYTQKTRGYAIFGQADYKATDRLTATVGLRWSSDKKDFDYKSLADGTVVLVASKQDKTFSDWSGRLGLRYELTPNASVYATFNRGYKSGGFFGGLATTPQELEPYANETLNAYEAGVKSETLRPAGAPQCLDVLLRLQQPAGLRANRARRRDDPGPGQRGQLQDPRCGSRGHRAVDPSSRPDRPACRCSTPSTASTCRRATTTATTDCRSRPRSRSTARPPIPSRCLRGRPWRSAPTRPTRPGPISTIPTSSACRRPAFGSPEPRPHGAHRRDRSRRAPLRETYSTSAT
jgi:iron complex outermembrane receptor protein